MILLFLKLFIITIFILCSSCNHENKKTNQSNFDKKTNTSVKIDSSILLTQLDTNQFPKNKNKKTKKERIANNCFFQKMEFDLPNISEALGDTLKIQNVYDWVLSFEPNYDETEIRKIVGRGGKYFHLGGNDSFEIIGFIEDDGEYVGIYIFSIDKNNCQIIGEELIAEATGWENGYKESYSIIMSDFKLKKIKRSGAKDWGDGTKWRRDTSITIINFEKNGNILLEKL